MPARSKVSTLPDDVRAELDRRLVEGGFGGYVELSEWLAGRGCHVSKSSLQRHGATLERRIEQTRIATESARTLVEAVPDDAGAMSLATLRMAQQRIFDLLLAAEDGSLQDVSRAARAVAELGRATGSVQRDRRAILAEAADRAESAALAESEKAGRKLSPASLRTIREQVYGIVGEAA